jgi:hypothetical protein
MDEDNALEKTYNAKIAKYTRLADELQQSRQFYTRITPIIVSSLVAVYPKSLSALQDLLKCNDNEIQVIGRRMSEAAIAGSFDIWRIYMGGPHPEEGGEREAVNREEMISGAGEIIADEAVPYNENHEGVIELWDEVDSGDSGPDETGNYETEEADDEDGHAGALEQWESPLLDLTRPGFLFAPEQEPSDEDAGRPQFGDESELELLSSAGEGIGYIRIDSVEA